MKSQQAVDGSLVSLHCWLADFADTRGNRKDYRHQMRGSLGEGGKQREYRAATRDGSLVAAVLLLAAGPKRRGADGEGDGGVGGMKWGIRVGGRTEGQSV